MAKASDNVFPQVIIGTGTTVAAPSDGSWKLKAQADGVYAVSSNTSVGPLAGGGLSNPMTTAGDIIYSSDGSGTPARLAAGTDGHVLTLASGVPSWAAGAGSTPVYVGCRVYNSGTISIASGSYVALTFNTEEVDTDGFHSTVTNTGRITIPAGKGGYYLLEGRVLCGGTGGTLRAAAFGKNGTANNIGNSMAEAASASTKVTVVSSGIALAAGDYVELFAYQDTGSNQNVGHASSVPDMITFTATLLGT